MQLTQTWCITQDDRGVMYFGTYDKGILEYDGKTWRKIQVPDSKPVNSMIKGDDGVIYVGTSGDFGFLEPTAMVRNDLSPFRVPLTTP